ncbi:MAG TPA: TldD/PmbA family protein [Porphyromonadaceae bacterium]|nr:TldD/PmbA family protein [Porphyromonadaceae bacterium]
MITKEQKDTLHQMMEFAQKEGADDCRFSLSICKESEFEYLNDELDKLQQSQETQLQIDLFVNHKFGSFSTNRMEKKELQELIEKGIKNVQYLEEDSCHILPSPEEYFKGENTDLGQCDPSFEKISMEDKLRITQENVAEIEGKDHRIISISGNYGDALEESYMLTSNGFEGETSSSSFGLSVKVALQDKQESRPSECWYDSSISWNALQKKGIGEEALRRVCAKLNPQTIGSGKYKMLLDNRSWKKLLSPILSAACGANLQQNNSFLLHAMDKKVFSEKLSITDNPHLFGAVGARWFDAEGVATQKYTFIEQGVLRTYYIDTYYAHKMNLPHTCTGISTLLFGLGEKDFPQLLSSMGKGVWVTDFNGGNSNPTTGDFSFGIEGFWVENGEIVMPISGMNITGNLLTLFNNIVELGNDPYLSSSIQTPSILFEEVDFSGE